MNITDLIVDLLQQGKTVEIPGIGTLRTEMQAAHHDPRTHTYYPARRVVAYSNLQGDSRELIANIARKECVSEEIAEMMLKNYIGALESKLQREGCHTFANIGTLTKDESGFGFQSDESFGVDKNAAAEKPIEHINTYTPKKADPFAAFEKPAPIAEVPQAETAEPVKVTEPEPVKVEKPEPVKTEVPEPQKAEKSEPIKAETPEPEKETEPEPVKEETPEPVKEEQPEPEIEKEPKSESTNELLQQLENIPDAPKTVEEGEEKKKRGWLWILIIFLLLLIGAGAYYYFVYMPAHQPAPIMEQTTDTIASQSNPHSLPVQDSVTFDAEQDSLSKTDTDTPAIDSTEVAEETEPTATESVQNKNFSETTNIFTFSTEQIGYTTEEVADLSKHVRDYMSGYLESYLSSEGYSAAKDAMMDSVESYANQRLAELLDNNKFCVQNFIPYNDYIHNYIESELKANKANRACVKVQTEIMDANYLAPKFNSIIDALQLEPAAVAAPKTNAPKAATRQAEPNYSNIYFASQSKKGFDIIAGFFKNKNGAAKLTQSLKAQGCDAYIISTNNGHYVSMGSSSNRTQADAMYKHIKSWYSGDVVIKQW